jgi:hypothetical protein
MQECFTPMLHCFTLISPLFDFFLYAVLHRTCIILGKWPENNTDVEGCSSSINVSV